MNMNDATIVVVDDEMANRELLVTALTGQGYTVFGVDRARGALDLLEQVQPDLLLVDIMMPEMDGVELCRRLKGQESTRLIPLVLVTALREMEDRIRGIEAGADDFLSKPIYLPELLARVRSLVRLKHYTDQLDNAEAVLYSLALGEEAKDPRLNGHCARLSRYGVAIGEVLKLDAESLEALRRGGIMHDVGKIAVPDAILFKPGPLTPAEWTVMREHPIIGERICRPLRSMRAVLPIIRHHHEHWDGSGYPDGLSGEDIPFTARILQVADVFDALTSRRPYRQPLTPADALSILHQEVDRGLWDGAIVETFADLWGAGAFPPDATHRASPRAG